MQNTVGVAEPHGAFAVEAVCINAGGLWRYICADAHHAPTQLVCNLERVKVKIMRRADQQRVEEFD